MKALQEIANAAHWFWYNYTAEKVWGVAPTGEAERSLKALEEAIHTYRALAEGGEMCPACNEIDGHVAGCEYALIPYPRQKAVFHVRDRMEEQS